MGHGSKAMVLRYVKGRHPKLILHSRQVGKQERRTQVPHFYSVQDPIPWGDTVAHARLILLDTHSEMPPKVYSTHGRHGTEVSHLIC